MREELKDCYILDIAFAKHNIKKLPLEEFYKQGYWISAVFGDQCYLIRKRLPGHNISIFACQTRYCELTDKGRKFIEEYAEKQYNKHKKYLMTGKYHYEKRSI